MCELTLNFTLEEKNDSPMMRNAAMTFYFRKIPAVLPLACVLAFSMSACTGTDRPPPQQPVYQPPPQVPATPSYSGPVLQQDGTCSAPPASAVTAIDLGIGECDLVRLKGKPPTDVLIGESGRGGRETQVLYSEPATGRELYLFTNNKLERIVK